MPAFMPCLQEFLQNISPDALRSVAPGQAHTLPPAQHARWLLLMEGQMWLTGVPTDAPGGDIWLGPSEAAGIPARATAVIENPVSPSRTTALTRFVLIEPAPNRPRKAASCLGAAGLRALRLRWSTGLTLDSRPL